MISNDLINRAYTHLKNACKQYYQEYDKPCMNLQSERVATFRIGYHWQKLLENDPKFHSHKYTVDSEYNKHMSDPKRAYIECSKCKNSGCIVRTHKTAYNFSINKSVCQMSLHDYMKDHGSRLMRPDLILHRRSSSENILAVEIKVAHATASSNKNSDMNYGSDFAKLAYLTCSHENNYGYKMGVFIELQKSSTRVRTINEIFMQK